MTEPTFSEQVISDALDILAGYHPDWGSRYDTVHSILSLGFASARVQERTKNPCLASHRILDQSRR